MQPEFAHLMNQERHADLLREAAAQRRFAMPRFRLWRRSRPVVETPTTTRTLAPPALAPALAAPTAVVPAQVVREVPTLADQEM